MCVNKKFAKNVREARKKLVAQYKRELLFSYFKNLDKPIKAQVQDQDFVNEQVRERYSTSSHLYALFRRFFACIWRGYVEWINMRESNICTKPSSKSNVFFCYLSSIILWRYHI